MRTAINIPDQLLRRAKAKAAEHGISLPQFIVEAVTEKVELPAGKNRKTRRKLAGALSHLHHETMRINAIIEEEFEKIDPDEWR